MIIWHLTEMTLQPQSESLDISNITAQHLKIFFIRGNENLKDDVEDVGGKMAYGGVILSKNPKNNLKWLKVNVIWKETLFWEYFMHASFFFFFSSLFRAVILTFSIYFAAQNLSKHTSRQWFSHLWIIMDTIGNFPFNRWHKVWFIKYKFTGVSDSSKN